MKKFSSTLLLCSFFTVIGTATKAVDVTVSIKPVHSIVAGVMGQTGEPKLLIHGAASPHTYQLKPSDAAALSNSELIVWVGDELETFLSRPINNLGSDAKILTLSEIPELELQANREGGLMFDRHQDEDEHGDSHDHHNHDEHTKHDGHVHGEEHDEGKHKHHKKEHEHHEDKHELYSNGKHDDHDEHKEGGHHHDHAHGEFDMHIWLSPSNAAVIVNAVAMSLVEIDPANSTTYLTNAEMIYDRIKNTTNKVAAALAPVKGHGFIVFHDAYQYFEQTFGLNYLGTIAVDPARQAGARRIAEIRDALNEKDIKCVFSEPQFSPAVVTSIIEGTNVKTVPLDPIGAEVSAGADAWFEIMDNLASAFQTCLSD